MAHLQHNLCLQAEKNNGDFLLIDYKIHRDFDATRSHCYIIYTVLKCSLIAHDKRYFEKRRQLSLSKHCIDHLPSIREFTLRFNKECSVWSCLRNASPSFIIHHQRDCTSHRVHQWVTFERFHVTIFRSLLETLLIMGFN